MISLFKNNNPPLANDENYYQTAKTWYQENFESVTCSRNRYRILVLMLGSLLALSLVAITVMMPLKSYIYRMIEVNDQTGEITVLKEVEHNTLPASWVMNRYFINQYIQSRESYSFEDIKRNFNLVIAMSAKPIANTYMAQVIDSNPKSPIKTLNTDYYCDVKVISINQLNSNTALARFKTTIHSKDNPAEVNSKDWQAVVKWDYVKPSESVVDRDKNPLGFSIHYYQVTPVFPEK